MSPRVQVFGRKVVSRGKFGLHSEGLLDPLNSAPRFTHVARDEKGRRRNERLVQGTIVSQKSPMSIALFRTQRKCRSYLVSLDDTKSKQVSLL